MIHRIFGVSSPALGVRQGRAMHLQFTHTCRSEVSVSWSVDVTVIKQCCLVRFSVTLHTARHFQPFDSLSWLLQVSQIYFHPSTPQWRKTHVYSSPAHWLVSVSLQRHLWPLAHYFVPAKSKTVDKTTSVANSGDSIGSMELLDCKLASVRHHWRTTGQLVNNVDARHGRMARSCGSWHTMRHFKPSSPLSFVLPVLHIYFWYDINKFWHAFAHFLHPVSLQEMHF